MLKIRKDDQIVVITGKDKGKKGQVLNVLKNGRLLISGINMVKKHQKPNPNLGIQGGIVSKEASIHTSNVAVVNPNTGKADRIGIRFNDENRKVRYFKSDDSLV